MNAHRIDAEAFEKLGLELGELVRAYLRAPPVPLDRTFAILEKVAGLAGLIIAGTEQNADTLRQWFVITLDDEIEAMLDARAKE